MDPVSLYQNESRVKELTEILDFGFWIEDETAIGNFDGILD